MPGASTSCYDLFVGDIRGPAGSHRPATSKASARRWRSGRPPIWLYRLGLGGLLGGGSCCYGARSQWFRNIPADPRVCFQVGRRHYQGLARPFPPAESGRRLAGYARRSPRPAASLLRAIGQDVDGSNAAYQRIGSDPEHGIPLVALMPE